MIKYFLTVWMVIGLALGMSEDEFAQLYSRRDKDAEACYSLYKAYAEGDGVEQDASQARKWLLSAHMCGMTSARKEIGELPWRKAAKLKKSITIAEVDDATARQKGEELVRFLKGKLNGNNGGGGMRLQTILDKADVKTVKKLIAEGADLNVAIYEGVGHTSALSLACQHADTALAKLLLDHGADPSANGQLALESCLHPTMTPRDSMGKKLNLGTMKSKGSKKLTQAELSLKMVGFLIKNGLDTHMWNNVGWAPVQIVAAANDAANLSQLIKAGMDVNQRSNPSECVAKSLPPNRISYLMTSGFVDLKERALYRAIRNYDDEMVEALVQAGADVAEPMGDGKTLLQEAEDLKDPETNKAFQARRRNIINTLTKATQKATK